MKRAAEASWEFVREFLKAAEASTLLEVSLSETMIPGCSGLRLSSGAPSSAIAGAGN